MNILIHPATAPIAQAICMPTSAFNRLAFLEAEMLSASALPISLILEVALPIQSMLDDVTDRNLNTRWIAPIAGMAVFTLAAYAIYAIPIYLIATSPLTSILIIGVASGIHLFAMSFFSDTENLGVRSFKESLSELFLDDERFRSLEDDVIEKIESQAQTAKALTLLVSTVSLTLFFKNPILANGVAYPLSVIVEIAATRVFAEIALIEALSTQSLPT